MIVKTDDLPDWAQDAWVRYRCTGCDSIWNYPQSLELDHLDVRYIQHLVCGSEEIDIVSGTIVE